MLRKVLLATDGSKDAALAARAAASPKMVITPPGSTTRATLKP